MKFGEKELRSRVVSIGPVRCTLTKIEPWNVEFQVGGRERGGESWPTSETSTTGETRNAGDKIEVSTPFDRGAEPRAPSRMHRLGFRRRGGGADLVPGDC